MDTLRTLGSLSLTLISLAILVPGVPSPGLASTETETVLEEPFEPSAQPVRYRRLERLLRERAKDAQAKSRRAALAALDSAPTL